MSDSHAAAIAPFTDAEVHEFRASDVATGRVIVLEMAGIFCIGLLLYAVVAIAIS